MAGDAPRGTLDRATCPSCGATQTFLTPSCRSCVHRYTAAEILVLAGALLETGMPRRSVRRQIAEAARGFTPQVMETAPLSFRDGGQGQRLAILMAVQDFGDPRALPPDLLYEKFDESAPAVKAEIILDLVRSESARATAVLDKLRSKVNDPRLLACFDDPFFRTEILPLHEPVNQEGPSAQDQYPEVQVMPEEPPSPRPIEVVQVLDVEPGPDDATPVEQEQVPEQEVDAPRILEIDGESEQEEPIEPRPGSGHTLPPPLPAQPPGSQESSKPAPASAPLQDLELESRPPGEKPVPARALGLYIVILVLVLVLGALAAWQLHVNTDVMSCMGGSKASSRGQEPDAGAGAAFPAPQEPVEPDEPGEATSLSMESHIIPFEATASTSHKKYPPAAISDGNPTTVWQEDKKTRAIGQYLMLEFDGPVTITRVGINVGYDDEAGQYGDMWKLNNRIRKVEIEFSDGKVTFKEFADERGLQYFDLSPPHNTETMKMTITDVYRGSWFFDNAVAEVEVWGYESHAAGPAD